MFACADKIEILALNFIHHRVHLGKAHDSCDHFAANHERRHTVGEAPVNHKVAGIGNNRRVKSGDIAHEIIETVARNLASRVEVNAVEFFHYLGVIRNLKIRNLGFTVALDFNIFTVVFAYRHARINDIRNDHHYFLDFFAEFRLKLLKLSKALGVGGDLSLHLFRFFLFALSH